MQNYRVSFIFFIIFFAVTGSLMAKDEVSKQKDKNSFKIGGGVYTQSNIRKDNKTKYFKNDPVLAPLPVLHIKVGRFQLLPDKAIYTFAQNLFFQLDARLNYRGHEYRADGMATRYNSVFGGVALRILMLKLEVIRDLEGKSRGTALSTAVIIPIPINKHLINLQAEIEYWDANYVDYYFGVRDAEATADRLVYKGKWATDYFFQALCNFYLSDHFIFRFNPGFRRYSRAIYESPTVIRQNELSLVSAIVYEF